MLYERRGIAVAKSVPCGAGGAKPYRQGGQFVFPPPGRVQSSAIHP